MELRVVSKFLAAVVLINMSCFNEKSISAEISTQNNGAILKEVQLVDGKYMDGN